MTMTPYFFDLPCRLKATKMKKERAKQAQRVRVGPFRQRARLFISGMGGNKE